MAIASYANKEFNVSSNKIYTFDEFSRSSSLNVEEQEVEGEKPSSYIKGSALEEISFKIPFIAQSTVNITKEIDEWIGIKDAKVPYYLILGNKPVGSNKYLLTSVAESETVFDNNGNRIRSTVQLQFKEFVRYGYKKEEGESTEEKSSKKRQNKNASKAVEDGPVSDNDSSLNALDKEIFGG